MADTAISARKKLAWELETVKQARDRLGAVATVGEQQEKSGRDKIKGLKQYLEEIDARAVALKSIRMLRLLRSGATLYSQKVEKQVKDLSTRSTQNWRFTMKKQRGRVQPARSLRLSSLFARRAQRVIKSPKWIRYSAEVMTPVVVAWWKWGDQCRLYMVSKSGSSRVSSLMLAVVPCFTPKFLRTTSQ